jgi:hypothetical protein
MVSDDDVTRLVAALLVTSALRRVDGALLDGAGRGMRLELNGFALRWARRRSNLAITTQIGLGLVLAAASLRRRRPRETAPLVAVAPEPALAPLTASAARAAPIAPGLEPALVPAAGA